jgi:hypothetical protein
MHQDICSALLNKRLKNSMRILFWRNNLISSTWKSKKFQNPRIFRSATLNLVFYSFRKSWKQTILWRMLLEKDSIVRLENIWRMLARCLWNLANLFTETKSTHLHQILKIFVLTQWLGKIKSWCSWKIFRDLNTISKTYLEQFKNKNSKMSLKITSLWISLPK